MIETLGGPASDFTGGVLLGAVRSPSPDLPQNRRG
jgi:hypothetical protein